VTCPVSFTRLRSACRLLALVIGFTFAALLFPVECWAQTVPTPTAPNPIAGSWSCNDRTADPAATPPVVAGSDCSVTGWAYGPQPTVAVSPGATLPVHEQQPPSPSSVSLDCASSASPSPSPTDSASPTPSPTSSDGSPSPQPCAVQVADVQVAPFLWIGGTLVVLAAATFVLTYSRRFRRLVE